MDIEEEAQLEAAARPAGIFAGGEGKDFRVLAAGTAQNITGLVVFVLGTFAANILISRSFGGGATGAVALGVVTIGTQFAFIAAAGTRFGMDMAAVRYVAIDAGAGHLGRIRGVLSRAIAIAGLISLVAGAFVFVVAGPVGRALSDPATQHATVTSLRAAAVAIPFVAITYVWLGGSRGLKVMRHTLYVMWVAQPILWIVLMVVGWQIQKSEAMAVWAYAGSWIVSAIAARFLWRGISRGHPAEELEPGTTDALVRYGAPRAPAALLSQGLFWIDYFVASYFVSAGDVTAAQVGVYSACVRVALVMVLFLTAVSYVFSPFVADLHARGERERLDHLFKTITRWTVAGTIPILLLMLIEPGAILSVFGGARFAADGSSALRILVIGQAINVSVGAAGFVLIMAGRTGWDLIVYSLSAALDLTLAFLLVPRFGIEGAAAAQAITIAASNWLRLVLVRRFVGIFPWDGAYARLALPAAVCAVAMYGAHEVVDPAPYHLGAVVVGFVGVVVYLPALLAFALTPEERTALRNGVAKLRGR
ncbi:MAG TPA: MATE family efflux transporter [Actinomycetota bacterium]|nr:MATE family efflux transporter [Actinomycetota bacterium]